MCSTVALHCLIVIIPLAIVLDIFLSFLELYCTERALDLKQTVIVLEFLNWPHLVYKSSNFDFVCKLHNHSYSWITCTVWLTLSQSQNVIVYFDVRKIYFTLHRIPGKLKLTLTNLWMGYFGWISLVRGIVYLCKLPLLPELRGLLRRNTNKKAILQMPYLWVLLSWYGKQKKTFFM